MPPRLILRLEVLLSTSLFLLSAQPFVLGLFRLARRATPTHYSGRTVGLLIGLCLVAIAPPDACAEPPTDIAVGNVRFHAEIAQSLDERQRGLMFRTDLADQAGMLFIQPIPGPATFWMKNTYIPLDLLYFDNERRLLEIHAQAPPCSADPCPVYASQTANIKYILEINAGTAERLGIQPGDRLSWP
ncbi:MAG: DUF192 domain-containing protein [Gammaproteobacteria bacterium]|nr:DUF192 domain-containing protein [Gammaproteobacteria bacterium]MCP5426611.1 DUF192 domain-containing protein [Gammaproteobacteria bacterium]MCP5459146.1 DUF192 domain-containing protein [Gammaproteobacteria bacterium]